MRAYWARVRSLFSKFLKDRPFIANVLTLMTSSTIAQIIPIFTAPISTRLYSPADYGAAAMGLGLAAVLSIVATGRYELAIMLPDDDGDAANVCALSVAISFILAGLAAICCVVFLNEVNNLFGNVLPPMWLFFVPPILLFNGIRQALNYWVNRCKRFKALAASRINGAIFAVAANIGLGLLGCGVWGLLIAAALSPLAAASYLFFDVWRRDRTEVSRISGREMIRQAARYKDFPQKSSAGAFMNILTDHASIFLIGTFFGTAVTGAYSLTLSVLTTPMTFIGGAVSQVLFPKLAEADRQGNLLTVVKKTTIWLVFLFTPIMLILTLYGDWIIKLVFGDRWYIAGEIVRIMAMFYLIKLVFSIQTTVIIIKRALGFEIAFNTVLLVSRVFCILIGFYLFHDYLITFAFISLFGAVLYLLLGIFIFRMARYS